MKNILNVKHLQGAKGSPTLSNYIIFIIITLILLIASKSARTKVNSREDIKLRENISIKKELKSKDNSKKCKLYT